MTDSSAVSWNSQVPHGMIWGVSPIGNLREPISDQAFLSSCYLLVFLFSELWHSKKSRHTHCLRTMQSECTHFGFSKEDVLLFDASYHLYKQKNHYLRSKTLRTSLHHIAPRLHPHPLLDFVGYIHHQAFKAVTSRFWKSRPQARYLYSPWTTRKTSSSTALDWNPRSQSDTKLDNKFEDMGYNMI